MWVERNPKPKETVKFKTGNKIEIGIYLRRGNGSAQIFWIVDIGNRILWVWELTTFEVWEA